MSPGLALSWLCKAAPLPLLFLSSLSTFVQMVATLFAHYHVTRCSYASIIAVVSAAAALPAVFLCRHSRLAHLTTAVRHE
jgi:hypothetical protein